MKRQILCFLFLAVAGTPALFAQDPVFSQFYSTPMAINPAFAGTTYAPRIAAIYRNQWPLHADNNVTAYSTYAASYEQFIPAFNSGIGFTLMSDDAGDLLRTTAFGATYAYQASVNDDFHIKIGVEAGFRQYDVDWDKLIFLDQLDEITGPVDEAGNPNISNEIRPDAVNHTVFDVSAGMLAYGEKFYGGFAIHHLTTPDESFIELNTGLVEGLPLRLTLHGGAQFIVKEGNKRRPASFISPNVLLLKQGDQGQINAGAYYNMGLVFAGGWYRHAFSNPDAVIAMVGVQYDVLKIGYSYDFTVSSLTAQTGGAHEISLVINLDNSETLRKRRHASRYQDCFKIFR